MRWFDNHCHLDRESAPDTVAAAAEAGVERMINVGTDESTTRAALAVAASFPGIVWATAGVHPHEASHGWQWLDAVMADETSPRPVAVGECGLDYHYDFSDRGDQQASFEAQIDLANRSGLPLVIHTREAWEDTFALLAAGGVPDRTVFHCFTGGAVEARRALDIGAVISFSGIITFKTAQDLRDAAALCPLDRLMVETDSPYLAPVPHRGKQNRPAWVPAVGAGVANAKGLAVEAVAEASWETATAFYLGGDVARGLAGEQSGTG